MSNIEIQHPSYVRLPAGITPPTDYAEDYTVAFGAVGDVAWCVVHAHRLGHYNGYVLVPEGSSLEQYANSEYYPHPDLPDEVEWEPHGGVTFSRNGWLGFDTGHAGDVWPGSELSRCYCAPMPCNCTYWTVEMVIEETQRFAHFIGQWDERNRPATYTIEQINLKEIL